jgi:hypothetical protein
MDMHKNIGAAIIRQDEAKSSICVEELHPASWHAIKPIQRTVARPALFDHLVGAVGSVAGTSRPKRPRLITRQNLFL